MRVGQVINFPHLPRDEEFCLCFYMIEKYPFMDEDFFLNNYADGLMIDWFRQLSQSGKGSFLEILSIIRCSPLGILDQFTVKGNTEQPDG